MVPVMDEVHEDAALVQRRLGRMQAGSQARSRRLEDVSVGECRRLAVVQDARMAVRQRLIHRVSHAVGPWTHNTTCCCC